jgi:hypothetical protein
MGVNVFKYMSFGAMFAELDIGELKQRYMQAKERASGEWYSLMKHRINVAVILRRTSMCWNSQLLGFRCRSSSSCFRSELQRVSRTPTNRRTTFPSTRTQFGCSNYRPE